MTSRTERGISMPKSPAQSGQKPMTSMAVRPGEVVDSVVGYVTLPPGPGGEDEGTALIEAAVERRHWRLLEIVRERDTSGRSLDRPGLSYALERVGAGEARALIVSDLRNLCRSIVDLASLVQWFRERQASLIALDLGLDTGTTDGQTVADVLITLAAWEHDRIADRTRKGLANAKARGTSVGRRAVSDTPELRDRIAAMRAANMTLQAIANTLNEEGIATMRGGSLWRPSSVQAVLGYRRPRTDQPPTHSTD